MRVALVVEYEGTNYHGFQCQANVPSIQEELESAIASLTGEKVRVNGAGRTDAGVHAKGQVVAFDTVSEHPPETFVRALNFYLPEEIAVTAAYEVDQGFDPRRDALSRKYRYTILNSSTPSPLMRLTTCLVDGGLDVGKIQEAAKLLVGRHDFARFAGPVDGNGASTVRRMFDARVERNGDTLAFDFEANAFLPHQVRRMAGSLVDVGRGKISLDEFRQIIDGGNGAAIAHSMPPQGLCLVAVTYAGFPPQNGR